MHEDSMAPTKQNTDHSWMGAKRLHHGIRKSTSRNLRLNIPLSSYTSAGSDSSIDGPHLLSRPPSIPSLITLSAMAPARSRYSERFPCGGITQRVVNPCEKMLIASRKSKSVGSYSVRGKILFQELPQQQWLPQPWLLPIHALPRDAHFKDEANRIRCKCSNRNC